MNTEVLDFLTTVTLNEGQGNPNLYQNVELSGLYHHTMFERNHLYMSAYKPMLKLVGFWVCFLNKSRK